MKNYILEVILFCILINIKDALGDRTSLKIYEKIQSDVFCFRRMNATHQIGCASHTRGDVGVLYFVDTQNDIAEFTHDFPPMAFVVALPISLYNMNNMKMLKQSDNIRGVLVLKHNDTELPVKSFSPDQTCPNSNFGLYTDTANKEYAGCKKKAWNKLPNNNASGMMFEDWGMPIFIVSNLENIRGMRDCYDTFNNGSGKTWPLCSVQMTSVMLAAKDTYTCMRRNKRIANLNEVKTCDPLSDKNVVNTLFPTNKTVETGNDSIIILSAKLDAFSMFDKVAPGAQATVTGLVTLLAIAQNMANLKQQIGDILEKKGIHRNVLFAIFNGETFDYIGSSRVVYDMERGQFPMSLTDETADQPALINLAHISHFVELSQLAPINNSIYLHTDPVSTRSGDVAEQVKRLVDIFSKEVDKEIDLKVSSSPADFPLPPASFQSFLRVDNSIPGIVIADHNEEFINRYYNSLFDNNEAVNSSDLTGVLAKIASAVTGTLYQLLTEEKLTEPVETSEELISGLLECYLMNASCAYFRQIADPKMTKPLRVEPYPLYVSVDSGGTKANAITLYTRYLLAYLTGDQEDDRNRKNCTTDNKDQIYHYDWMTGKEMNESGGICVKSTVMYTLAESPAFDLNDWRSTRYSTWTESVWMETNVRIFLQPGKTQEGLTLLAGFIVLLLSICCVYFVNQRASLIFNTKPLVGC